jgi:hypothetical protein
MSIAFTIADLERAINYWCTRQQSGEDGALCPNARRLADIYGLMIYERSTTIEASRLTADQREVLRIGLYQDELPL